MTPLSLLLQACGLTQSEAADLLGVRKDTVVSWASGRRTAPEGAILTLRETYLAIQDAADLALEHLSQVPDNAEIVIGYPADDHEAQALGFPSQSAWRTMAGIVLAELDRRVTLVPRGSTPETAAAIEAHDK